MLSRSNVSYMRRRIHACHVIIVAKPLKFSYFLLFLHRFLLLLHTTPGRVVGAEAVDNVQHFALAILWRTQRQGLGFRI